MEGVSTVQPGGYGSEIRDQTDLVDGQFLVGHVAPDVLDQGLRVVDALVYYVPETAILGQLLLAALVPVLGELDVGPIIADPAEDTLVPGESLDDGILLDGDLTDDGHG